MARWRGNGEVKNQKIHLKLILRCMLKQSNKNKKRRNNYKFKKKFKI